MARNNFYSFLILILTYLFIVSIPVHYITNNEIIILISQIGLRIFYIFFLLWYAEREEILRRPYLFNKTLPLFIPTLIICFSNIIYLLLNKNPYAFVYNNLFPLKVALTITTAFCEELLFRKVFIDNLAYSNKMKVILINAALFGGIHLVNILNSISIGNILATLQQAVYTAGLGLILGTIYCFTNNVGATIFFHFVFNFMNNDFFDLFYQSFDPLIYYVCAAGTAVIAFAYLITLYKIRLSKIY